MELRRRKSQDVQPQTLSDPVTWITSNFYIPETKAPVTLAPYQETALREALSRDERGLFRYSTIVWSDIKKSAKTTIAGAVVMWMAFNRNNAKIRLVGNDLKQADSRVFNAIADAVMLNPKWRTSVKVIQHKVILGNGSVVESVPVDPAGEAGGNDDMLEWTELWAARHDVHKKMWSELTLSPTKFGQSFRWTDTYAGYQGESEILESLYNQAVKDNQPLDLGIPGLEAFANVNARLFVLWNTKPRLSWQTPEYYAQESSTLLDQEFRRMHRNEWVSSVQTFVPRAWWDACRAQELAPLAHNDALIVALDAGVSDDCFAMVAVSRPNKKTQIRYARKWTAPVNGKIDFANVEVELRKLLAEYYTLEVCYDPYQLHDFCTRMGREIRTTFFREFPQGQDRIIADKQLYDAIRDKNIEHRGEPDLGEHIQNANAKTEGENKLRIVKRSQAMKIDLCVALSMANARAVKLLR